MAEEDDFEDAAPVVDADVAAKVEEYYNSQRGGDNAAADEAENRLPDEYYDKQNEQRAREAEDREMAADIAANRDPVETTGTPRSISPQPDPDREMAADIRANRDPVEVTGTPRSISPQPPPQPEGTSEAEGMPGTIAREAGHAVVPGMVGLGGAVATGAAVGSAFPGLGTLAGAGVGLLAGLGVGTAASVAQEWLLKKFGFDDEAQRAANQKENPVSAGVGTVLGLVPSMGVGAGAAIGQRAIMAGVGGGIDLAMTGDPMHALGVAGASAVLNKPTALGETIIGAGERVGTRTGTKLSTLLAERAHEVTNDAQAPAPDGAATKTGEYPPGFPGDAPKAAADTHRADVETPGTNTPGGRGQVATAPTKEGGIVSEQQNQPTRSERNYGQDQTGVTEGSQDIIKPLGSVDQGVKEALAKPADEVETPPGIRQQAQQEQPKPPAEQPPEMVQQLKEAAAKNAAARENPPNAALDEATQRAIAAGQRNEGLMKQGAQLRAKEGGGGGPPPGGPPREPPPPPHEPPEPGPKAARLDQAPLLSSAPEGGIFRRSGNLLRRVFAPEFMSPASEKAGEALRRGMGQLEALNNKWTGQQKKYYPEIEKLDRFGKDALTDKLEGGTAERFKDWQVPEALKPLVKEAEAHNAEYKEAIARVARDPETVKEWNEQYLTHIYKNPKAERQGSGGGVRGSSGSLNERKYATYEQAKQEAGHERAHENPLDSMAAYRASLGNHLALEMAKQEMREGGHLKYAMPEKNVGASGQGSSLKSRIHKDWEAVPGLMQQGRMAYMPRDAANVFNNHLMPDFSPNKDLATVERIWREGGNRASQMALGIWNGFHSFVVSTESAFSQVARGTGETVSSLRKGDTAGVLHGLKDIGTAPAAPVKNYLVGRQGQAAITGNESRPAAAMEKQGLLKPLSEDDHAIIKAAQDAGYMPLGRSHAPDVNMTGAKDYYESAMKGQFGRMMHESLQNMKDNPLKNVPKEAWDHMGRVLQTLSRPLFQHYIPALKFGALIENARAAVRQGKWDLKTPEGQEKLTAFLRKESNVIDNRMGEMNAKNVFMNKAISRAGYGSMLSFSWMLGSARAVGGGTMSGLKSAVKDVSSLARGKFEGSEFANKLDMTHKDYDPNVAYAITFPIGAALMGAAYTFMRTGEMPQDWRDLYFPRTGGKVPGLGGKGQVDERIMLPGYHKEFFGWTEKGLGEAYAKMNPAIQASIEELQNKDWRNLPIVRPDATLAQSATDRAAHVAGKVGPLAVKTQMETPKEGTALSRAERALGFRPTGMQHTDPVALKNYLDAKYKKDWETKVRSEERAAHGGVNPPKEKKPRASSSLLRMPQ